jgi:hypothetical protein
VSRIFEPNSNVFDAKDVVVADGYVAVEGTKTPAVKFCNCVIDALGPYRHIGPVIAFQTVANRGYLYLVVDTYRFSLGELDLRQRVDTLDRDNPI